jgi:hypothetical protein
MRINEVIIESNDLDEGAIGAGLGALAGSALGPVGSAVGAGLGSAAGDWVSNKANAYMAKRNREKAKKLRAQADALDGGNTSGSSNYGGGGSSNYGGRGGTSNVSYSAPSSSSSSGASGASSSAAGSARAAAKAPNIKSIQTSLQHVPTTSVDRIRGLLQRRAGVAESVELDELNLGVKKGIANLGKGIKLGYKNPTAAKNLSKNPNTGAMTKAGRLVGRAGAWDVGKAAKKAAKWTGQAAMGATKTLGKAAAAAPGAVATGIGKTQAGIRNVKGAYQTAKGATMTPQDLEKTIATMTPQDAKDLLDFFNTIHPAPNAPATPAAQAAPATTPSLKVVSGGASSTPSAATGTTATPESVAYFSKFLGRDL